MSLSIEQDSNILFTGDADDLKNFVETHKEILDDYDLDILKDEDYTVQQKIQALFSSVYGVNDSLPLWLKGSGVY